MNLKQLYLKLRITKDSKRITPQDLREMRKFQYKMTQEAFAIFIGVCEGTYGQWERGRCKPPSAAQSLLLIVRDHPDVFYKNREKILKVF